MTTLDRIETRLSLALILAGAHTLLSVAVLALAFTGKLSPYPINSGK